MSAFKDNTHGVSTNLIIRRRNDEDRIHAVGSIIGSISRASHSEPQWLRMLLSICEGRKSASRGRAVCRSNKSQPIRSGKEIQAAPAPAKEAAAVSAVVLKDVHFDFDKYLIRPQDAQILKQDFSWVKANPGTRVRVEGNCDERGTVEYNLALGQKRADATKSYLITLGADAALLDTVSYGKERAVDPGHNEAAWAKNRRAHLEPVK